MLEIQKLSKEPAIESSEALTQVTTIFWSESEHLEPGRNRVATVQNLSGVCRTESRFQLFLV